MNQEKIGKLIAKLRKEKGLTQQQLGDMVGVGYRAVSKWETGLTMPDISNINELCKILGITSDELLKGELNKKKEVTPNKKFNKKLLFILIPIIVILSLIISIIVRNNNKIYEYNLKTGNRDEYLVNGDISFKGKKMLVNINKIEFEDYTFNKTIINNYQYRVLSNKKVLYGFGYGPTNDKIPEKITISELMENFTINYTDVIDISKEEIINNNIALQFIFTDTDNNQITKDINILLIPKNNVKSTA